MNAADERPRLKDQRAELPEHRCDAAGCGDNWQTHETVAAETRHYCFRHRAQLMPHLPGYNNHH